jgi:hypothetical protein
LIWISPNLSELDAGQSEDHPIDAQCMAIKERSIPMPVETVLYLVFVVSMLTLFAAALAYAEAVTRHSDDHRRPFRKLTRENPVRREDAAPMRKAA